MTKIYINSLRIIPSFKKRSIWGSIQESRRLLIHRKNVIIKTVGFEENVEADVFTYKVSKNDIFLICSDGLSGYVSDPDIARLVNKYIEDPATVTQQTLDNLVKTLIDQANSNGGKDNISVIISVAQ